MRTMRIIRIITMRPGQWEREIPIALEMRQDEMEPGILGALYYVARG